MLKMRGSYVFAGKCPKHPRYDPAKQGIGAIKGGCDVCWALWNVYSTWVEFLQAKKNYEIEYTAEG